jgi:hypothetical protein
LYDLQNDFKKQIQKQHQAIMGMPAPNPNAEEFHPNADIFANRFY